MAGSKVKTGVGELVILSGVGRLPGKDGDTAEFSGKRK